jgi:predicted Zn-dependent protease with MMP-like domain
MISISREEFEAIVEEGIRAIPQKFLNLLNNVDIVIEDMPSLVQRKKIKLG